jgi:hypothetical protein
MNCWKKKIRPMDGMLEFMLMLPGKLWIVKSISSTVSLSYSANI